MNLQSRIPSPILPSWWLVPYSAQPSNYNNNNKSRTRKEKAMIGTTVLTTAFNYLRIQEQCRRREEQQCKGLGCLSTNACTQSQAADLTQRKAQCPLDSIHLKQQMKKKRTPMFCTVNLLLFLSHSPFNYLLLHWNWFW